MPAGSRYKLCCSGPADRLRQQLTEGRGRLLLVHRLERHQAIGANVRHLVGRIEQAGSVVFIVVTLGLTVALYRGRQNSLFLWALAYLLFVVVQVICNVLAMVATASNHQGKGSAYAFRGRDVPIGNCELLSA